MNWVEKHAEDYLQAQGYQTAYEPDGNCPPDFVINGSIAVEDRRLNEIRHGSGALDHDLHRLHDTFADVLKSFGSAQGISWWVSFSLKRPTPRTAHVKSALHQFLDSVLIADHTACQPTRIRIGGLEVDLQRANVALENVFTLGAMSDVDSGGSVTGLLIDSTNKCVEEKARKVEAHRHRYDNWWLLLVNTTSYRLHPDEISAFRSGVKVGDWSRIICLGLPEANSTLTI